MRDLSQTWHILKTTFQSIGHNWSSVLRATFLPMIVPLGLLLAWGSWAWTSGYMLRYFPTHVGGQADFPFFAAALALLFALGTLPAAIAWHRFDLKGEAPRALRPRLHFGLSLGYMGRSLLIMVIMVLLGIPLMLLIVAFIEKGPGGGFTFNLGALPEPMTPRNFLLNTVFWAILMAFILRWSLILPAGAVGHKMTLREAREAAKARFGLGVFLLLGVFLHLAPIAIDRLLAEMALSGVWAVLILPFVFLFWFMFGIALLTTLYARCVVDRADMREAAQPPGAAVR